MLMASCFSTFSLNASMARHTCITTTKEVTLWFKTIHVKSMLMALFSLHMIFTSRHCRTGCNKSTKHK